MSLDSHPALNPGHRLFARYAHAPNALGYCGPAAASALQRVACGREQDADGNPIDVRAVARQFSGAWPYQLMVGELAGIDPLSEEVGRAYWTGSALTGEVDARRLGEMLLERFAKQAGHYWAHLTPELLDEIAPTHAFHVLAVYPWSRLLPTGLPEPLQVLDSCRIRTGEVLDIDGEEALVSVDTFTYDGTLALSEPRPERVQFRTHDGVFADFGAGDHVAVHWGFACDRLTEAESASLQQWTQRQLELTNPRLRRESGAGR